MARVSFGKGSKHTPEARAKMSAARRGVPKSDEWKAKIAAANRGQKRTPRFPKVCPCGLEFLATQKHAVYCSRKCGRAARGHGLVHAPEYAHFPRACAICSTTATLVGDHDHATGEPRGVLCRNCNLAIGYMADDPERLVAAARYLGATA